MTDDREEIKYPYINDLVNGILRKSGINLTGLQIEANNILREITRLTAELEAEKKRRGEAEKIISNLQYSCGECGSIAWNSNGEETWCMLCKSREDQEYLEIIEKKLTQAQERIKSLEKDVIDAKNEGIEIGGRGCASLSLREKIQQLQSENAVLVGALKEAIATLVIIYDDFFEVHFTNKLKILEEKIKKYGNALANSPNSKAYAEAVEKLVKVSEYAFTTDNWNCLHELRKAIDQLNKARGL